MYNNHQPSPDDLPTKGQLLKSTVVAAIAAAFILVTIVLPAEYGIDPTGFGNFVGLLKMGEIKVSLADESAAEVPSEKPLESESIVNSTESFPTDAKRIAESIRAKPSLRRDVDHSRTE